jgi:hypothetical protein
MHRLPTSVTRKLGFSLIATPLPPSKPKATRPCRTSHHQPCAQQTTKILPFSQPWPQGSFLSLTPFSAKSLPKQQDKVQIRGKGSGSPACHPPQLQAPPPSASSWAGGGAASPQFTCLFTPLLYPQATAPSIYHRWPRPSWTVASVPSHRQPPFSSRELALVICGAQGSPGAWQAFNQFLLNELRIGVGGPLPHPLGKAGRLTFQEFPSHTA